ncbi:putative ribonuclease H-like domain-containing protein, partial [Tanacetum coccineum]
SDHEYHNCPLHFDDKIRFANLLPLEMSDFDISLDSVKGAYGCILGYFVSVLVQFKLVGLCGLECGHALDFMFSSLWALLDKRIGTTIFFSLQLTFPFSDVLGGKTYHPAAYVDKGFSQSFLNRAFVVKIVRQHDIRSDKQKLDDSDSSTLLLLCSDICCRYALNRRMLNFCFAAYKSNVQIPHNNLDNLQSIREEKDGATKVSNPRDVPGSILLAVIDFATLGPAFDTDPLILILEDTSNLLNTGIFSGAYVELISIMSVEMDVKSAFLYGTIEEEVYVCQPPSFEDPQFPDKVYKVEKALYGLHQSPRAWYETLSTYLLENGFRRGTIDKTLSIKKDKGDILLMQRDDGIFISQDKYVADILKKFDFVTVKTASTPIETNKALLKDEEAEDVDFHLYKSKIGSLTYLTASRPHIIFVVCACARFQVTPKVSHLHAVKRIFRYLKGQPKLGLWYPRDSPFNLETFLDSDYARASLDRKSTTGGCQFLGKRLISWQCKKQTVVTNSTTEAE